MALLCVLLTVLGGSGMARPTGQSGALSRSADRATVRALDTLDALRRCPPEDKGPALAAAIVAGEDALRNPLERGVEDALARIGAHWDVAVPDLSFGPAQIRPAHYRALRGTTDGFWRTVADACRSLAFTRDWIGSRQLAPDTVEGRRTLLAAWSGHRAYDPLADDFFATAAYYDYFERLHRLAGRR